MELTRFSVCAENAPTVSEMETVGVSVTIDFIQ